MSTHKRERVWKKGGVGCGAKKAAKARERAVEINEGLRQRGGGGGVQRAEEFWKKDGLVKREEGFEKGASRFVWSH